MEAKKMMDIVAILYISITFLVILENEFAPYKRSFKDSIVAYIKYFAWPITYIKHLVGVY